MRQTKKWMPYALVGIAANGLTANPARADERGDDLLRQVRATAYALAPLVGEYTVTLHDKTGDKTDFNQVILSTHGGGFRGGLTLPTSVFNLFEPVTRVPADTRYLGRKSVGGETYDVVELKLPPYTFQVYIGDDGLIHRAHTILGIQHPFQPVPIDPKTGRPTKTPDELIAESVVPPTQNDARDVDVVVTSYRKPRLVPDRPDLSAPLQTLAFHVPAFGKYLVTFGVALSPDGTRMAVAFADEISNKPLSHPAKIGTQIFDVASGEPQAALDTQPQVMAIVFSPDGKQVATSGYAQTPTLWDAKTGRRLFALDGAPANTPPLFTPDGKRLVCPVAPLPNAPGQLLMWDAQTGQSLPPPSVEGVAHSAFSPDGSRLATLSRQGNAGKLLLWDTADWKLLHTEQVQAGRETRPVYSPDGQWLALIGDNGVVICSGDTGAKARELTGETGMVSLLQFAGDGKALIAIDEDTRGDMPANRAGIVVWDTGAWQKIGEGSVPNIIFLNPMCSVSIAADGKTFAISDIGKGARVWAVPGR